MRCGLWSWTNHLDNADVAVSSESAILPSSNLFDPRVAKVWRADGATSASATLTLGSPGEIAIIGAFGLNAASLTIRLDGVAVLTAVPPDPDYHQVVAVLDPPVTASQFKAELIGGDPQAEAGRFWGGPIDWEPSFNFTDGASVGPVDLSTKVVADRSGCVFGRLNKRIRRVSVGYDMIYLDELHGPVRVLQSFVGTLRQVVFIPDPAGDIIRDPVLAYQTELNPTQYFTHRRAQAAFALQEAG